MTGDSDIIAYGRSESNWDMDNADIKKLHKVLLVDKYRTEWYRIKLNFKVNRITYLCKIDTQTYLNTKTCGLYNVQKG